MPQLSAANKVIAIKAGNIKASDKVSIAANYGMGRTHVDASENSLLKDFSSLSSDWYSLGMVGDNGDPALPPIGKGSRLLVRLELLGSNQTNGHRRYFFSELGFYHAPKKNKSWNLFRIFR